MTQADMVVDGVLPIDQMREYSAPTDLVCRRVPKEILEGVYGIGIGVKEIEEGGTGEVLWEDLLSSYASELTLVLFRHELTISRSRNDESIIWYARYIASRTTRSQGLRECQTPVRSSTTRHRPRLLYADEP